jgi:hypothetical protein
VAFSGRGSEVEQGAVGIEHACLDTCQYMFFSPSRHRMNILRVVAADLKPCRQIGQPLGRSCNQHCLDGFIKAGNRKRTDCDEQNT